MKFHFLDGERSQIYTSADHANEILDLVATRVPTAAIGYTAEAERTYKQRRAA